MEKYELITKSIYDYEELPEWEENEKRLATFCSALSAMGIDSKKDLFCSLCGDWRKIDKVSFYGVNEALDAMAIKDGVDFIRFEDGHLGMVGYYSGLRDIVKIYRNVNDDDVDEDEEY